ncbi:ATPase, F1/V1/A1 complex, alpha/beta subunit [Tanacetum coccineum]
MEKFGYPPCFDEYEGINGVLKNGSWFIRSVPIILKKWTHNVNLLKEDLNSVPVWVELHDIPIIAFTEDGLSAMTTKLGTPIMLDSYMSIMEDMIIDVPVLEDDGEVLHTARVEYECQKFQFKPIKQVYEPVSRKNGASLSDTNKRPEKIIEEANTSNPFDALNTVDLESSSVTSTSSGLNHGTSSEAFDDDWKLIKASKVVVSVIADNDRDNLASKKVNNSVNADSEDEVFETCNETASFIAYMSFKAGKGSKIGSRVGNTSFYEQWKETYDSYDDDDFDDYGFSDAQQAFAGDFYINLHGQL